MQRWGLISKLVSLSHSCYHPGCSQGHLPRLIPSQCQCGGSQQFLSPNLKQCSSLNTQQLLGMHQSLQCTRLRHSPSWPLLLYSSKLQLLLLHLLLQVLLHLGLCLWMVAKNSEIMQQAKAVI